MHKHRFTNLFKQKLEHHTHDSSTHTVTPLLLPDQTRPFLSLHFRSQVPSLLSPGSEAVLQDRPSLPQKSKPYTLPKLLKCYKILILFYFFSNKKKWSCGTRFFVPSMKEVISSISNNFHYNYLPAQEVTPSWKRNKLFSLSGTGINNAVQLYQPPYLASQLLFFSEKNFRTARWMAMHIHQPQASNKRVAK